MVECCREDTSRLKYGFNRNDVVEGWACEEEDRGGGGFGGGDVPVCRGVSFRS